MTTNPFMGYGSPEVLERVITAEEDDHFVVYGEGLIFASVCSDLPVEEVVKRMGRRISGTTEGFVLSENETFSGGQPNPCPCEQKPSTHKHYLFNC